MARIRSIHPGQWRDQDFVECGFAGRLLAIALRNEADDQGVFEWKPKQIKMNCFPGDSVDVDALLVELVRFNIVKEYEVEGRHYGAIRNFRVYQRPKTPNAIHPLTPEILEYVGLTGRKSGNGPASQADVSEIEDDDAPPISETLPKTPQQMEEEGGKRKEEGDSSSLRSERARGNSRAVPKSEPPGFSEWYQAFPLHKARPEAAKAYRAALTRAPPEELLAGAQRYATERQGEEQKFTAYPATWLNKNRWQDDPTQGRTNGTNGNHRNGGPHPASVVSFNGEITREAMARAAERISGREGAGTGGDAAGPISDNDRAQAFDLEPTPHQA